MRNQEQLHNQDPVGGIQDETHDRVTEFWNAMGTGGNFIARNVSGFTRASLATIRGIFGRK